MSDKGVLFIRSGKAGTAIGDSGSTTEDDIWDDTALIEAYDRAVNLAKDEVVRRMGIEGVGVSGNESSASNSKPKPRRKRHRRKEWQIGSPCRAVYSEDGQVYEAEIQSIQPSTGHCVIRYVGYGNEEQIPLKHLQPSGGPAVRMLQTEQALQCTQTKENGFEMDCSEPVTAASPIRGKSFIKSPTSKKDWSIHGGQTSGRKGPYPPQFAASHMPSIGFPPMVVPPPPPPHLMTRCPDEDMEGLSAMLMSWYMSGFHTGYYQGLRQCKKTENSFKGNLARKS